MDSTRPQWIAPALNALHSTSDYIETAQSQYLVGLGDYLGSGTGRLGALLHLHTLSVRGI